MFKRDSSSLYLLIKRGRHELPAPANTQRARDFRGVEVPPVLVSGNHGNIDKWRLEESKKITKDRRPDLWDKYQASHREDNKKKRRTRKAD